jgi:hypothetical protein
LAQTLAMAGIMYLLIKEAIWGLWVSKDCGLLVCCMWALCWNARSRLNWIHEPQSFSQSRKWRNMEWSKSVGVFDTSSTFCPTLWRSTWTMSRRILSRQIIFYIKSSEGVMTSSSCTEKV